MGFYDGFAHNYDVVTDTAGRAAGAEEFISWLVDRYAVCSAIDVACGTGLYTLALARRGVRAIGSDISEAMLDQARERAAEGGMEVQWVQSAMQDLTSCVEGGLDAVLCMGNSLPHLLEDGDLKATLEGFLRLLHPGGVVAIHLLNYTHILARQDRIVGVSRQGEREYIRFYDFLPERIRFNLLEVTWQGEVARHRLESTLLRPYQAKQLSAALEECGFCGIEPYGGLKRVPFEEDRSETLLLLARRPKS